MWCVGVGISRACLVLGFGLGLFVCCVVVLVGFNSYLSSRGECDSWV